MRYFTDSSDVSRVLGLGVAGSSFISQDRLAEWQILLYHLLRQIFDAGDYECWDYLQVIIETIQISAVFPFKNISILTSIEALVILHFIDILNSAGTQGTRIIAWCIPMHPRCPLHASPDKSVEQTFWVGRLSKAVGKWISQILLTLL